MSRSEQTEACWPTETREELLASIRAEHGDAVAAVVERDWQRNTKRAKTKGNRLGRGDAAHNRPDVGWYADKGNDAQKGIAVRGRDR